MQADVMTPDQRLYIQSLEQSSTYLSSVVSRLQDFASLMHGQSMVHSVSFDMAAIITGIAEAMQHFIEQDKDREGTTSHIELHLDPKLPLVVYGDLTKVQQILRNLATIAVSSSTDRHASIKVDLLDDGPTVHMRITVTSMNNTTPGGLLDGIGIEFNPEELFKPTSYNNMYQGLVISREFLYMIGSRLETSWTEDGCLSLSFDLKLGSPRTETGGVGADNQSNYGDLVANAKTVEILLYGAMSLLT
jgi:K+-sensing histidine kinase KdpD